MQSRLQLVVDAAAGTGSMIRRVVLGSGSPTEAIGARGSSEVTGVRGSSPAGDYLNRVKPSEIILNRANVTGVSVANPVNVNGVRAVGPSADGVQARGMPAYDMRARPADTQVGPIVLGDGSSGPGGMASPFRAAAEMAAPWSAGYGSAAVVGGMFGMMADPDNKAAGFAKGAAGGMLGGGAFRAFSRKGAGVSSALFAGVDARLSGGAMGALSRGWNSQKHVIHKGMQGFHNAQGRNNMFRSGAMLGGGAFGVMFASNGRSHKRGFNKNRGNSFTR